MPGLQIEARMVPWAAHGIIDDKAVTKRTTVVRAMCPNRKHIRSATHEQNLLLTDIADQRLAVME
jgi:sulfite reductase beta subunit-like hemoprotein